MYLQPLWALINSIKIITTFHVTMLCFTRFYSCHRKGEHSRDTAQRRKQLWTTIAVLYWVMVAVQRYPQCAVRGDIRAEFSICQNAGQIPNTSINGYLISVISFEVNCPVLSHKQRCIFYVTSSTIYVLLIPVYPVNINQECAD